MDNKCKTKPQHKQTVNRETAIGFFRGNSSIIPVNFLFLSKQRGNLRNLKIEREVQN